MELTATSPTVTSRLARLGVVCSCILLGLTAGCPTGVGPDDGTDNTNDNGTPDGTGEISGEIVNFLTNFGISKLGSSVSVMYTASGSPDSIAGFYVPVADNNPGASAIADRVIITTNLPAGTNRFFNFDPGQAGVGFYRVGILLTTGTTELAAESEGIIQVQGPPEPFLIQPINPITEVNQGSDVYVSFDAGDPEGDVHWRLFYLTAADSRSATPDQLGTQLATGTGNVGAATFPTAGLQPGDYELGISATDSGTSIAATVANGDSGRIVTIPNATEPGRVIRVVATANVVRPTLTFITPGAGDAVLFRDEQFMLEFKVTIFEPGATGRVVLFYDTDDNVNNGFDILDPNLPHTATTYPLPTDLPEGTYHIGGQVRTLGGVSPTITAYAMGTITVIRNPSLTVTAPNSPRPVAPSTEVTVVWATNAPADSGTVDVFLQTVDSAGNAFGPELSVLQNEPITTTSATIQEDVSGVYQVSVRIEFTDGTDLTAVSPEPLRVSSLPPIVWLGSLASDNPAFEGAIFGGVNPEDNAGAALTTAGDLDGDGNDEFVIGARYGKPFFNNPSGIGAGEAYIIYGGSGGGRPIGEFNLNSVATDFLRGIALTGITPVGLGSDTDGLSDITLIPDADGDDRDELAFGFPRVNSQGGMSGPLEGTGQFLRGGVVILSSDNSILEEPMSGTPVIRLQEVGQRFSSTTVPSATEGQVLRDSWRFEEGNLEQGIPDRCGAATDGIPDTIIGSCEGFDGDLAPSAWQQLGFAWVTSPPAPAEGLCATVVDLSACLPGTGSFPASGFYPAGAVALEPRGARLIGRDEGDRFGTSITASNAPGGAGPGDLLVGAPGRTARAADVTGLSTDISNSGIGFLFDNRLFWGRDTFFLGGDQPPPTPHQYIPGQLSHVSEDRAPALGALMITGETGDQIENILGIGDFNGDGRNDFVVGAPRAGSGQGRVYIAYRREETIEGNFILGKLKRDPNDAERLDGMLIVASSLDGLGSSLAGGFNFNGDEYEDLVIGSPNAGGGVGEVIILFGNPGIVSDLDGLTVVDDLLRGRRTTDSGPAAARITGNALDPTGQFGFNVANAGDVDGDGLDDLLVAAPNASPHYDPDPNDNEDEMSEPGLDLDYDGLQDDVTGPNGQRNGRIDPEDLLQHAGIVYLILGSNRLDQIVADDVTISVSKLGGNRLRGLMIVGRAPGDRLGGGDAGDVAAGGIDTKFGRGRSRGLASAGDVDGDNRADLLIGSVLADPRRDPNTGTGVENGGEAYLIYGSVLP